jgi:hypothetical protein
MTNFDTTMARVISQNVHVPNVGKVSFEVENRSAVVMA